MRRATIGALTVGLACTSALLLFATRGRDVTIPAGTTLQVMLDTTVGSDISRPEQPVRAHLARTLTIGGAPILDTGTVVSGVVTDATRSARVKGRAHVAVLFDTLVPKGGSDRYTIESAPIGRIGPRHQEEGRARNRRAGSSGRHHRRPHRRRKGCRDWHGGRRRRRNGRRPLDARKGDPPAAWRSGGTAIDEPGDGQSCGLENLKSQVSSLKSELMNLKSAL